MTELLKLLNNKRLMKTQLKNATSDDLTAIIERLIELQEEKLEAEKMAQDRLDEERKELEDVQQLLLDKNIDFDKLSALMGKPKRKRNPSKKPPTSAKPAPEIATKSPSIEPQSDASQPTQVTASDLS